MPHVLRGRGGGSMFGAELLPPKASHRVPPMRIQDIDAALDQAKTAILSELGIDAAVIDEIQIAAPPQPEMGDRGFPCFVLARHLRKAPPAIAAELAPKLETALADEPLFAEVRPVGPYVNVSFDRAALATLVVGEALDQPRFGGDVVSEPAHWMFEYSAPNTNKPQHLGHVRNDLLGQSVATVCGWAGHQITRVNLINDRGIHICKSMLAYQLWGQDETPQTAGVKGDHLVGDYYVLFDKRFNAEYADWQQTEAADARLEAWLDTPAGQETASKIDDDQALRRAFFAEYKDDYFNRDSELGARAKAMLRAWEDGEPEVVALWRRMNQWVFDGFDATYARLGVEFDRVYYESNTYELGKDVVRQGLEQGVFRQLDDGAVVCDLDQVGLDGRKVLLRSDGTSVYMTQDLGTAIRRFEEFDIDRMVYVVGNEQDYHFQVLFKILGLVRPELAGRLYHLSYGMVLLPEGKMKSREGKVVDADDLMDEMVRLAEQEVRERYEGLDEAAIAHRAEAIGMAALKFFILDFNPRSTVHFDPKKSIDFQGRTGPYCLYSYARIQSIARNFGGWPQLAGAERNEALGALSTDLEMGVVRRLQEWPDVVALATRNLDPSKVTEHLFNLCKAFSSLYNDTDHRIVDVDDERRRHGLLLLSKAVADTLEKGLSLLGIATLDEM